MALNFARSGLCALAVSFGLTVTGTAHAQGGTPSTSAPLRILQVYMAVTDLDLGAADTAGKVGQEIVIVIPDRGSLFRIVVVRPDGTIRFDLTKPLF